LESELNSKIEKYARLPSREWCESTWFVLADREYRKNQLRILDEINECGKRILDVGCDDGSFTCLAAKKAKARQIIGVEINVQAAKKARERGVQVVLADANKNFPFTNCSFRCLISNQVIEHLELQNIENFLKETHRVLENNGYAIISTPNITSPHNLLLFLHGSKLRRHKSNFYINQPNGHKKIYSIKSLKASAENNGFEIHAVFGSSFYLPNLISNFLSKTLPSLSIYISVKIFKQHAR